MESGGGGGGGGGGGSRPISTTGVGVPPTLLRAEVAGDNLVLYFSEPLTAIPASAPDDFSITLVDGVLSTTSEPAVQSLDLSGSNLILTLNTVARFRDRVSVSYTTGTDPIVDTTGDEMARFSARTATNNTPGFVGSLAAFPVDQPRGDHLGSRSTGPLPNRRHHRRGDHLDR